MKIKVLGAKGNILCQTDRIENGFIKLGHELVNDENCDFIFVNDTGFYSEAIEFHKKYPNAKLIMTVLDVPFHIFDISGWLSNVGSKIFLADAICVISETVKNQLLNTFPMLQTKGVTVIYNPIKPVYPLNLERNNNLLMVGRICDPNKRFKSALELAAISDMVINVVGPENPMSITNEIEQKYINYLGVLKDEDLNVQYNTCKAVLCSSIVEGLNLVAIESLVCKTPVLCWKSMNTAQEFIPKEFISGESLYDLNNTLRFITSGLDKVNDILNEYSNKYISMFAPEQIAKNIIEVYEKIK